MNICWKRKRERELDTLLLNSLFIGRIIFMLILYQFTNNIVINVAKISIFNIYKIMYTFNIYYN